MINLKTYLKIVKRKIGEFGNQENSPLPKPTSNFHKLQQIKTPDNIRIHKSNVTNKNNTIKNADSLLNSFLTNIKLTRDRIIKKSGGKKSKK